MEKHGISILFWKQTIRWPFVAIRHGKILAERYYNGHSATSISLSFSMAKSFTSILIGMALEDGYLRSEDQKVTEFIPELKANGFDRVTLRHLLQMTSGSDYIEADHPFCVHPWYYYTEDMTYYLTRTKILKEPGTEWRYKSGDNELLALILQRVLPEGTTITDYMQRKLWEPLGMEDDAPLECGQTPGWVGKKLLLRSRHGAGLCQNRFVVPQRWRVERAADRAPRMGGEIHETRYQRRQPLELPVPVVETI